MIRRLVLVVTLVASGAVLTTAVPASAGPSDLQVARTGTLVRADFPTGWTQGKRSQMPDAELDAAAAQVESCAPFLAFSKANRQNPRARSPKFAHDHSDVANTVSVYPSTAKATAAMRTFSDPQLPDCLQPLFSSVFEQQLAKDKDVADLIASVNTVIAPVTDLRIGDEAIAYQGTVDITDKDGTVQTIGLGIVSARVDDAVVSYSWTSDTDISATLQPAIVKSVNRLQRAQAAD